VILDVTGTGALVSPVAGHGWVSWNSRLTEADRYSLAEAEIGSATPTASKARMRRTVLTDRRTLLLDRGGSSE